ncbi:MAG: hypothetical protein LC808_22195 [Actinobacteria bacterium]|nr:hypothetical protein [Actinomycetota bacterium]
MILYIETSAAAKLLVNEPGSSRLATQLDSVVAQDAVAQDDALLSGILLETELRRLAVRMDLAQYSVTQRADAMVTYDRRQADAAEAVGLPVLAP